MNKVLILDCWMRKGLSVVRALGREGIEVHCLGHKSINPARFSKYTRKFFLFPNPDKQPKEFINFLLQRLKSESYNCLIPLEEGTIDLLLKFRKEIEKLTIACLPDEKKFNLAVDKWNSVRVAEKCGVPVPESYCPQNNIEVKKTIQKIGFPLIIKPRRTSGGRGLKKINTQEEFNEYYPDIVKNYGRPLLQEYIREGEGALVWMITDNDKVLADFSYRRLRKYPLDSGPGTMWESTDDRQTKEYSRLISKKLKWKGIIIVEFKIDSKDNNPKFMEINPRLGGSTAHPLFCGINFPYLMYLQALNIKFNKTSYKIGRRTRWLIADFMHFISNKNRWNMKPSFFEFFDKDLYYEEIDKTDIKGSAGIFLNSILYLFDFEIWKKGILRK